MNVVLEIGFRFLPPDEQIISFFLKNKMIGDHTSTRNIREVDLLKHEPWQLPALSLVQSTYQEWLFFYKLNKISEKKTDRLTNHGFWKSTGADRQVSYGGRVIGTKKTLVFHKGRTPCGEKTDWVMHEYRANPSFLPHNADNSYVVGYLRNTAAEKTENSISNVDQPSAHFVASSSPKDAVGVTPMEVSRQPQSESMDYAMALQMQMQMQMEDEGIFASDLSSSRGPHDLPFSGANINNDRIMIEDEGLSFEDLDLPSTSATINNEQIIIEEEGISFEDLEFPQYDELVDGELNERQLQFGATDSFFQEHSNFEAEHIYGLDYRETDYAGVGHRRHVDPEWDNAWCDQIGHMTDESHNGHSKGLNQKRMETGVHHDDILIMDSGVESATVTAYKINRLESVQEERSVNSRACKSESEPSSHKSVAQRHPRRVQWQGKSSGKAVSRDKTRESGIHSPVVQPVQNKKSGMQANKSPKMDQDRNTKLVSNSRTDSRKSSFHFVEMSELRCKPNPPLVYVRNVIVGSILFMVVAWEAMFIR
ncbi:hypothetical protein HRI_001037400 [Hibiscus trionum]|uniref:NAC domain-containing protein n=1 Tax=Hibiscus trionum TaxID=183268 RepID=A0A9W7HA12_HIBTR|nr:hypothetical protein HRI_001037400 [Hibiscus trionum]